MTVAGGDALPVAHVDLGVLAPGRWHALAVALASDARGAAIRAPVLVARGAEPGPSLVITAALHGDEVNGVAAIHQLVAALPAERVTAGAIVAVPVANVPGFLAHRRFYDERTDLNHVMPGAPEGDEAELYAHRLFDRLIRGADLLCDLHTASRGRRNALYVRADLSSPACSRMAHLTGAQILLHHLPTPTTLRGAATAAGTAAITVEIGDPLVWEADRAGAVAHGLLRVAVDAGIVAGRSGELEAPTPPIVCARSFWLHAPEGGLLRVLPELAERVSAGQTVARLVDVYGREVAQYRSPDAGIVIGRSTNPVGPSGARILHLGIPSTANDRFDDGRTPLAAVAL